MRTWLARSDVPLFESIRDALRSGPNPDQLTWLAAGAGCLIAVLLVAHRLMSAGQRRPQPDIDYLTAAVDLLELSERDRRDLVGLARRARLRCPAAMLLSPACLAQALARDPQPDPELRARLDALSRRLFDAPLPEGPG